MVTKEQAFFFLFRKDEIKKKIYALILILVYENGTNAILFNTNLQVLKKVVHNIQNVKLCFENAFGLSMSVT